MMPSNLPPTIGITGIAPAAQSTGAMVTPKVGTGNASGTVKSTQLKPDGFQNNSIPPGLQRLERMNDASNTLAESIKVADETMQEIDGHLDKMKDELIQYVKQNPPYPPGSEERVKMLKNLSSLRKLIDKLTFPPENSGAAEIMGPSEKVSPADTSAAIETGAYGQRISQI